MTDNYEALRIEQVKCLFSFWDPAIALKVAQSWSAGVTYRAPCQSTSYRPIPGWPGKYIHRIFRPASNTFAIGISTLVDDNEFVQVGAPLIDPALGVPGIKVQGWGTVSLLRHMSQI